MEEAQRCDRLGLLDRGQLVALGTPDELRASVGGDCLTVHCDNPSDLALRISEKLGKTPTQVGESLRIETQQGHEFLRELIETFPDEIKSVTLGKPTLEDVFIGRTGHRFWEDDQAQSSGDAARSDDVPHPAQKSLLSENRR